MDPALDMSHEAMDRPVILAPAGETAWHRARRHHWGSSELAALLIAIGWRSPDDFNGTTQKQAPGVIARKAGTKPPLARTRPMELGSEREAEIWRIWYGRLCRGQADPHAMWIDPEHTEYVEGLPPVLRCLSPRVDDKCHALSASVDVLARDYRSRLGAVDIKASYQPYDGIQPRHVVQLNVQMACTGATWATIVEARYWSNEWADDKPGLRRVVTHPIIERDDALIDELRRAAREGWARVEAIRAAAQEDEAA